MLETNLTYQSNRVMKYLVIISCLGVAFTLLFLSLFNVDVLRSNEFRFMVAIGMVELLVLIYIVKSIVYKVFGKERVRNF